MCQLFLYALLAIAVDVNAEVVDLTSAQPFAMVEAATCEQAKAEMDKWLFYLGDDKVLATREVSDK